jgi:riboflavin kinase/FMN adenylyltransferase
MRVFETLEAFPPELKGGVLAIGNFDGVHKGHRALLAAAKEKAEGKPFGVLTFEPHPRKLFRPDDPPFRLTPKNLKHRLLAQCGVDFVLSLPFDWDFASQSAEDFVQHILRNTLAPSLVITGEDFRFGQLRKGSLETIRVAGIETFLFGVRTDAEGEKFASTAIRQALRQGEIETANALLGWEWEIEGSIFRGDRRGHELGYPTANVLLKDTLHPAYGVYATFVQIEGEEEWRMAATNIGIRPMFELKEGQVEAHILDFEDRDIYGRMLCIKPVKRLRGEAKFPSLEALIEQIEADCVQTRKILSLLPPLSHPP